ncbi:MAG: hypothetical protein L3K23_03240 [Thermoplasmata archaeon]|nr:hypothetical protein [Thermoplasmata archaeon]
MMRYRWVAPCVSLAIVGLLMLPSSGGAGAHSHPFGVQSTLFLRSGLVVPGNAASGQPHPTGIAWDSVNGMTYVADAAGLIEYFGSGSSGSVRQIYLGVAPGGIAVDGARHRLYVTEPSLDRLAVFNASTGQAVTTVPVGSQPEGVAVDAALGVVLVVNSGSGNLTEVRSTTDRSAGSLPAGPGPFGIAVDTRNGQLFVTDPVGCPGAATSKCNVSVINASSGSLIAHIKVGQDPTAVVYDSANNRIYVAVTNSNRVAVINASANAVATSISFMSIASGLNPRSLAIDPALGVLFASDQYEVEGINTTTNTFGLRVTHAGWGFPGYLAFDTTRNTLLVTDAGPGWSPEAMVHTYSPAHNRYGADVQLAASANGVAFDPANGVMYVSDGLRNAIYTVGAVNGTIFGTVPRETPGPIGFDPLTGHLFVGHGSTIDVLNGKTYGRVAQIADPHGVFALAFDSRSGNLWVANQDENVTVYRVATNTTVATVFFNGSLIGYSGQSPYGPNVITGFAFDPQTHSAFIEASWWDDSCDCGAEQVGAINASTFSIVRNWTGPWFGGALTVDPLHFRLYQLNYDPAYGGAWVNAFNARTLAALGSATIYPWNSGYPGGLGWAPTTSDVYVSGTNGTNDLFKVNTSSYTVAATVHPGSNPAGVVFDPLSNRLWVAVVATGAIAIVYP